MTRSSLWYGESVRRYGVELHGRAEAAALVGVNGDEHFVTIAHGLGLLAVRQKEVLGKTPVEEGADAVDLRHRKGSNAAELRLGQKLGCDGAILRILIDKNRDQVADGLAGELVLRK